MDPRWSAGTKPCPHMPLGTESPLKGFVPGVSSIWGGRDFSAFALTVNPPKVIALQ